MLGHRNVLRVLPTGGGKSVEISHDVLHDNLRGIADVTIAHRKELVTQMSMHVARAGVYHRIIGPANVIAETTAEHRREFGRSFINPTARSAVAGIDTLMSRREALRDWGRTIRKWRIDEAHHVLRFNKWGLVDELFPYALGLGVTASPRRPDGQGLGRGVPLDGIIDPRTGLVDPKTVTKWSNDGLFDHMVNGPTMRELINMQQLTDYEFVIPTTDFDVNSLRITDSGDFSPKQMREASAKSRIVGDVVVNYCKFALGKQAIVFATDVATSAKMAAQFNMFGIPAASVSADTPAEVRSRYIREFKAGKIRVLCNVDLFGEGFDLPAIEVVIMARPTASIVVYLQQIGRALRLMAGKRYGLIIDMVSNLKRHGFPDKAHAWSLDRRDKNVKRAPDPDDMPITHCETCYKPFEAIYRCCPHCGAPVATVAPGAGGGRSIEQVDGDLMLLSADVLEKMRNATVLETAAQRGSQAAYASGIKGIAANIEARQMAKIEAQGRLGAAIDLWAGQRVAAGDTLDMAYRRFYQAMGTDVLSVMNKSRNTADYLKTFDIVQGWLN